MVVWMPRACRVYKGWQRQDDVSCVLLLLCVLYCLNLVPTLVLVHFDGHVGWHATYNVVILKSLLCFLHFPNACASSMPLPIICHCL